MSEDSDYVCSLDSKYEKKAKNELFEVPSDRLAAVTAFRDWIKEQKHIKCPQTDTLFLLTILRWSKWSQVRARERLEAFITMFQIIPRFRNIDVNDHVMMETFKDGWAYISPERTDKGELVLIFDVASLARVQADMTDFIKAFVIIMMYTMTDEMNQVNGVCFFLDYSKLSAGALKKLLSGDQSIYKAVISRIPGRWKHLIYYRAGPLFETVIAFFKPLMPKKIYERVSTHDNLETIYPLIPKRCFPVEYLPDDYKGHNAGTVQGAKDRTISLLTEAKTRQQIKFWSSDAFKVDKVEKPDEVMNTHFRKLNVD